MNSAVFHVVGNVFIIMEQLIISVIGPYMTGRQSLIIRVLTLSDRRERLNDTASSHLARPGEEGQSPG